MTPAAPPRPGPAGAETRDLPLALVMLLPFVVLLALLALFMVVGAAVPMRFDLREALARGLGEARSLALFWALAALAAGTLLAGRARARAVLAVAGATVRSFVRHPLFWILAPGMVVLVVLKVISVETSGSAFEDARLSLKNAVGWAAMLTSLLAVLLPAISLSDEFVSRSAYVNLSKPVGRSAFLAGKLLGCLAVVGLFLAVFLAVAGAFVRVRFVRQRALEARAEAEASGGRGAWSERRLVFRGLLEPERLPGGAAAGGERPGPAQPAMISLRAGERYRAEFRLPPATRRGDGIVARVLGYPGSVARFFDADLVAATEGAQGFAHRGVSCRGGETVEFTFPAECAAGDGRLVLELVNPGGHPIRLPRAGAVWIAMPRDGLETGLAKAWLALMARAALLGTVSLACATVLSFQVSAMTAFFVLVAGGLVGYAKSWVARIVESALEGGEAAEVGLVAVWLRGLTRVLPDLSAADPAAFVGDLEYIRWSFLLAAALSLLAARALPCALAGALAFGRREAD